jgi:hypothetical protein
MGKLSRLIGHIFVGGALIGNPSKTDTGDHTVTGTGQQVTEPNPKGKKERKEEEGGTPAAGE